MKDHKFTLQNLTEVTLTENDMFIIHEYYVIQQNADYFRNNYPIPEEKIMEMAWAWRDKELQENYSNEEALAEVLEEYGLITENIDDDFDDSAAWKDDSDRGCSDCPDDECTGHCMSCSYRPV